MSDWVNFDWLYWLFKEINKFITNQEESIPLKMILPFNYVKSFEDHRKDKSMIHS